MDQFKKIIRFGIENQAASLTLSENSLVILHTREGSNAEQSVDSFGLIDGMWLKKILSELFSQDFTSGHPVSPALGELNASKIGKIVLIVFTQPQLSLKVFFPPDGKNQAKKFMDDYKKNRVETSTPPSIPPMARMPPPLPIELKKNAPEEIAIEENLIEPLVATNEITRPDESSESVNKQQQPEAEGEEVNHHPKTPPIEENLQEHPRFSFAQLKSQEFTGRGDVMSIDLSDLSQSLTISPSLIDMMGKSTGLTLLTGPLHQYQQRMLRELIHQSCHLHQWELVYHLSPGHPNQEDKTHSQVTQRIMPTASYQWQTLQREIFDRVPNCIVFNQLNVIDDWLHAFQWAAAGLRVLALAPRLHHRILASDLHAFFQSDCKLRGLCYALKFVAHIEISNLCAHPTQAKVTAIECDQSIQQHYLQGETEEIEKKMQELPA